MDKEIREYRIPVRVTLSEREMIKEKAEKVNKNVSDFLRCCAKDCKLIEKPDNEVFYKFIKEIRSLERAFNNLGREAHNLGFVNERILKEERKELNDLIIEIKKRFI